ncbi:MAG TPA: DoxX family protein [Verrucomicrobiales bacterium]|nr:DoxX family protein [Verrucomicrobiales bacterium]
MIERLTRTAAPACTILIRLSVGLVFLSEGIQKFLLPDTIGAGRFAKIGIPSPQILGPLVGGTEIVCGAMVLCGLLVRLSTIPLVIIMLTAIGTTKLPMLGDKGFWFMAHESRTDFAMLLGSLFLLCAGAGRWSADAMLSRRGMQGTVDAKSRA